MVGQDDESVETGERRKGGCAAAAANSATGNILSHVGSSASAGLFAGFIYLIFRIISNCYTQPIGPLAEAASLFLGPPAMSSHANLEAVLPVGLASHFSIALFWGVTFGLILAMGRSQWTAGSVVTFGILFGLFVWIADYYLFAPMFWPWLKPLSSVTDFLGHAFFFGLPLGIWVAGKHIMAASQTG